MSVSRKKYNTGFAIGGMYHHEFMALKSIIQDDDFAAQMKSEGINNKYLAIKTEQSRKRVISEILKMHEQAPIGFWDAFYDWNTAEQKLAILFLRLKTYALMFDLHFEVTIKKYRVGDDLQPFDITMRLEELASIDDHVGTWSDSMMYKLNTKYRGILFNAGLYARSGKLNRTTVENPLFWNFFEKCNEAWFLEACFIR